MYIYDFTVTCIYPEVATNYQRMELLLKLQQYFISDYHTFDEVVEYCLRTSHDYPNFAFKIVAEGEEYYDLTTIEFYKGKVTELWELPTIDYEVSAKVRKQIQKQK